MFLSDKLCHKLQLGSVYPNHKISNFNVHLGQSLIYISHRLLMLLKVRANIVFLDFHVNSQSNRTVETTRQIVIPELLITSAKKLSPIVPTTY